MSPCPRAGLGQSESSLRAAVWTLGGIWLSCGNHRIGTTQPGEEIGLRRERKETSPAPASRYEGQVTLWLQLQGGSRGPDCCLGCPCTVDRIYHKVFLPDPMDLWTRILGNKLKYKV